MFVPPQPEYFFSTVWRIVEQIPLGKVSSYGQIASMIPPYADIDPARMKRLGPRWVGTALRRTPHGEAIPWQRVINSQGGISFPAGSAQATKQRQLLEQEGISFDRRGRVDFNKVGWLGPDAAFLRRYALLPPRRLSRR